MSFSTNHISNSSFVDDKFFKNKKITDVET